MNHIPTLNCGIVQDLLPLYTEQLTGAESTAAVQNHLAECSACRDTLADLQTAPTAEPVEWAVPLRKVDKVLRRRRWQSILLAVCLVLAAAVAAAARLTEPQHIAYGYEGLEVRLQSIHSYLGETTTPLPTAGTLENAIILEVCGSYAGCKVDRVLTEEDGVVYADYTLSAWRTPLANRSQITPLLLTAEDADAVRVWYTDYTHTDLLLFGSCRDNRQTLPRLALNYYALLSAAAAAVLGLAALLCRRQHRLRRAFWQAAGLPACWLTGHLAVKFPGGSTAHLLRNMGFILVCAALLYAAGILADRLRQNC